MSTEYDNMKARKDRIMERAKVDEEIYKAAFQRGAEAMRAKCVETVKGHADWALSTEQAQDIASALSSVEIKESE